MSEYFQIAQSIVGGGSSRGNSYWTVAANCGHRRRLTDALGKQIRTADEEPDWAIRGQFYHLLMQWWGDGKVPETQAVLVSGDTTRISMLWNEACTLFEWTVSRYPKSVFGEWLGTEVQIPRNSEDSEKLAALIGIPSEWCPTARYDAEIRLSEANVEMWYMAYGVTLPGPGRYILDYKHGASHNSDDAVKYTTGEQPVWYLAQDRLLRPNDPVRGMIFPKVTMTKEKGVLKMKDSSFRVYVATWQPSFTRRSVQMIRGAYESMVADTYGPYHCSDCSFYMKSCLGYDPRGV